MKIHSLNMIFTALFDIFYALNTIWCVYAYPNSRKHRKHAGMQTGQIHIVLDPKSSQSDIIKLCNVYGSPGCSVRTVLSVHQTQQQRHPDAKYHVDDHLVLVNEVTLTYLYSEDSDLFITILVNEAKLPYLYNKNNYLFVTGNYTRSIII